MTNLRTAAQQALEALEWNLAVIEDFGDKEQLHRQHKAITALRAALAEPVQEPVAGAAKSVHEKAYSEVELAAAYQKGWNDAMWRRSLGPHIITE